MSKKVLYRTVIKLEILSEEPIPEGWSISDIIDEATDGAYSMSSEFLTSNKNRIIGKTAVMHTKRQGTDPEFFGMDENGNEIDL